MAASLAESESTLLAGERVGFVGKLGGFHKREAMQLVRRHGGVPVEQSDEQISLLVIGADQFPPDDDLLLDAATRAAADAGQVKILTETEFCERLGLVGADPDSRRLYTPAMLAELLRVSVATIRRWHRRSLILPAHEVHRLPYFDFQEVTSAKRLAQMLAAGISPAEIERKLAALSRYVRGADRSLAQLGVIVEGRQILLRQGEGLVEPNGQMRFDFESLERAAVSPERAVTPSLSFIDQLAIRKPNLGVALDELRSEATRLEEEGELSAATEVLRAALAAGGPSSETCFQLGELLYRLGDLSAARERYFMAIELDENFVEARANLGCVLAESGDLELAEAAFRGALVQHPDYADVHYHLARTLGELNRGSEAADHWRAFLHLAPDSPWAEEARMWLRLG